MKAYTEEPDENTSRLNSGMLNIFRLNDLWKDTHKHSRGGNYSQWNDDLDRVWCELAGDEKEDSDAMDEYEKLNTEFAVACSEHKKEKKGFGITTAQEKQSFAKQKKALMKKEIFLRRLQNKQGKGTAYHDSSEDYMD